MEALLTGHWLFPVASTHLELSSDWYLCFTLGTKDQFCSDSASQLRPWAEVQVVDRTSSHDRFVESDYLQMSTTALNS